MAADIRADASHPAGIAPAAGPFAIGLGAASDRPLPHHGDDPGGVGGRLPGSRHSRRGVRLAWLAALAAGCAVRDEPAAPPARGWQAVSAIDSGPLRAAVTASPTSIEYVEGCESGLRRAAEDRRPLLLVFRASWCGWSEQLARETLADERLVGLSRRFVCVAVDADRDAAACRRFAVDRFPTVLLLDVAGVERFRATGSTAAGLFDAMAGLIADRERLAAEPPATPR